MDCVGSIEPVNVSRDMAASISCVQVAVGRSRVRQRRPPHNGRGTNSALAAEKSQARESVEERSLSLPRTAIRGPDAQTRNSARVHRASQLVYLLSALPSAGALLFRRSGCIRNPGAGASLLRGSGRLPLPSAGAELLNGKLLCYSASKVFTRSLRRSITLLYCT